MTAGNNGASTPEDDDPFGYLYEDGQASTDPRGQNGYGYPGPAAQPGVPRTSYNQVRSVGERQYGHQQPTYGQQGQPQQPPYGQQSPYGQAPNAQQPYGRQPDAGAATRQVPAQRGGGRGSGPNTKGLLIGAVAVVALVVIGISIAIATKGDDKVADDAKPSTTPTVGQSAEPSASPTGSGAESPALPPEQDAAALQLTPPAVTANQVPGAKGAGGSYVSLAGGQGAAATWTVNVPKGGAYTLFVDYGVPGEDAKTSLTVNGKLHAGGLNMKNFANAAPGDWAKGWTNTYAYVNLNKGENSLTISCGAGDQCQVNLDQVSLKPGQSNG